MVSKKHHRVRGWRVVLSASPPSRNLGDRVVEDNFYTDTGFPVSMVGGDAERTFRDVDLAVDTMTKSIDGANQTTSPRGYRREGTMEQTLPNGGVVLRTYYREQVVTFSGGTGFGGPTEVSSFSGSAIAAAIVVGLAFGFYVKVVKRFQQGFQLTIYAANQKSYITTLWPWLWLANQRGFREEFGKAVAKKGGGEKKKNDRFDDV